MKNFSSIAITFFCIFLINFKNFSQGCVAVRHMSCSTGNGTSSSSMLQPGQWQVSLGFRNLHSHRHFVGTEEQTQRALNNTEVINDSQGFDLGISYAYNSRLSFALNIPFAVNVRASKYEHYGNTAANTQYFDTHSTGIGDMRLTATYWLLDPLEHAKGNIALGLGVKAPTGNSNVQDQFHKLDKEGKEYLLTKAVDQSIQLGDGGWGANIEIQGYQQVLPKTVLYFNGFYLFNPRNVNNTLTSGTKEAAANEIVVYHSVADQFAGRVGASYALLSKAGLSVSFGGRIEGVPAHDVFGKSEGFRRPGYIISVEPGVVYSKGKNTFALSVPIATTRNRIQSVADLKYGKHGDAAFADYFISATLSHRF